jgi:hypothetical protein
MLFSMSYLRGSGLVEAWTKAWNGRRTKYEPMFGISHGRYVSVSGLEVKLNLPMA